VPSALDGFPLFWTKDARALKSKPLKRLPPRDQEACKILAGAGGFDAATLISLEYNAELLGKYICAGGFPYDPLLPTLVGFLV